MARSIFVGDIQACREELEALLDKVRFDPSADRLLPLGDLVGRGPDALGTLSLLKELNAEPVLGNHDLHALRVAAGRAALRAGDRLEGLLESPRRGELLDWLAAQPLVRLGPTWIAVHAGLHPKWRAPVAELSGLDPLVEHPAQRFATRVRHCTFEGRLPERDDGVNPPGPGFRPWFDFYRPEPFGGRRAIYGHWATRGLNDLPEVLGLDTGCVWGRALTAWIAEENRLVHVPARATYAAPGGPG